MPEDESYLNKRGLTHFWENIDDIKQNKLTAGAGITITNDVISATGGGTADSVDWGHITGLMSNQADLTTALAAKANSADLATVATSGSYNDLVNAPTNVSAFTNDAGYITSYTDNKTAQTLTKPTTSTTYYPVASASSSTNTADVKKFSGVSLSYSDDEGGAAELTLGKASLNGSVAGSISLVDSAGAAGRTTIAGNGKNSTENHTLNTPDTSGRLVANSSSSAATGSATHPVYADASGILHATTYTLEKSVPSNAVFTDTTYSDATTSAAGLMSASDKTKLNGVATGAEVNVQSDWNVTDSSSDAFIKNKPTIPAAQVNSDWNAVSGKAQILNKPTLATVATTGAYGDLTGTPTIPTVNNATLTIQKNGTNVQTFTANQATNATANITVPTKTSDLTNDSGFISTSDTGSVSTAMLANGAVTTAKIADEAVTSSKIDWTTFEDFTSRVSFTDTYANAIFLRFGRIVWFFFQGSNKSHTAGETSFTVPAGYRPKKGSGSDDQVWFSGNYASGNTSATATTFYIRPSSGVGCPNVGNSSTTRLYVSGMYYIG